MRPHYHAEPDDSFSPPFCIPAPLFPRQSSDPSVLSQESIAVGGAHDRFIFLHHRQDALHVYTKGSDCRAADHVMVAAK